MLTEIQKVILNCFLGPEDLKSFFKFQQKSYRRTWLDKQPPGYTKEKNRTFNLRYPGKHKESAQKWNARPENQAHRWSHRIEVRYGISAVEWRILLDKQQGKCQICKKDFVKSPHIDHCHETGMVRGLLCFNCNAGIGYLKNSPEICASAGKYLSNAACK